MPLFHGSTLLALFFVPNENDVAFTAGLPVPCHQVSCVPALRSPSLPLKNLHEFTAAWALLQSSQYQQAQPPLRWFQPISSPKLPPAQAGSCSFASTRHQEGPSKGSLLKWRCHTPALVKDTVKKLRKSNRAKGTARQGEND